MNDDKRPSSNIDPERVVSSLADRLVTYLHRCGLDDILMIGVRTGGVWVAERLRPRFDCPLGRLNISFYRDDFSRIGVHPTVTPSCLSFRLEDRHVVLVDDFLYTGRTVRAALNEIFDYGRPATVTLAVLFDREGRELPIQADVVGHSLTLDKTMHAKLTGPDPLALSIHKPR